MTTTMPIKALAPCKDENVKEPNSEIKESAKGETNQDEIKQRIISEISNEFSAQDTNVDNGPEIKITSTAAPLSKRAQKRLNKREAWLKSKKERKELEKAKRKDKIAKRKAEEPDLPSYSESRKRIKNTYVGKVKSPVHIGSNFFFN